MQYPQIRYIPEARDPSITLETSEVVMKVIDNTGLLVPEAESTAFIPRNHRITPYSHHLGYHGIRTFYRRDEKRNLVVPYVSWLNLQGLSLAGLEPDPIDARARRGVGRGWPFRMEQRGAGAAVVLDPMPSLQMGYSLDMQPAEPDGLDFSIRFQMGRRPESGTPRLSASWPCYMNAYDDVRLFYPKGEEDSWEWQSVGEKRDTIIGETVDFQWSQEAFHAENVALPLAYGVIGSRVWMMMFSDPSVTIFVGNAGGHLSGSAIENPAWDFGWVLEDYPVDESVGFDGRIIYADFEGPDQVIARYREWIESRA